VERATDLRVKAKHCRWLASQLSCNDPAIDGLLALAADYEAQAVAE
jgi:hypothetical protein